MQGALSHQNTDLRGLNPFNNVLIFCKGHKREGEIMSNFPDESLFMTRSHSPIALS